LCVVLIIFIVFDRDPRDVVLPFFMRLEEAEHKKGFEDAVKDFIKRIQERVRMVGGLWVITILYYHLLLCDE
jgi:hypothetical protein